MTAQTGKCAMCGDDYTHYGNNPVPALPDIDQRVCDDCNSAVVIPARLGAYKTGAELAAVLASRQMGTIFRPVVIPVPPIEVSAQEKAVKDREERGE